jgi:hypothetical protein
VISAMERGYPPLSTILSPWPDQFMCGGQARETKYIHP